MMRLLSLTLLTLALSACVTQKGHLPIYTQSELQEGQREFNQGYYKRTMRRLLPLACDGVPAAQYAIGYMYYYGYGVPQDTDVGYFWIKRAGSQAYGPALSALTIIENGLGDRLEIREQPLKSD